jgi:hypothetical protein
VANTEYRLVVAGELSSKVSVAFEGMTLTRQAGRTIVHGPVRDQVHLQGLLQRISDLGLTLISAMAVEAPAGEAEDGTVGG